LAPAVPGDIVGGSNQAELMYQVIYRRALSSG